MLILGFTLMTFLVVRDPDQSLLSEVESLQIELNFLKRKLNSMNSIELKPIELLNTDINDNNVLSFNPVSKSTFAGKGKIYTPAFSVDYYN
jgi:hypothetical protein